MEPLSHAILGAAVATLSGEPANWTNPVYVGAALGAVAPDLDIVFQAFGDMVYLRHHRGLSHSIPGVAVLAGVITLGIAQIMHNTNWMQVLLWTFLGGLSHIIFDMLNSYGAQIFAPFYRKRLTFNLLQIFDPVVLILALGAILTAWVKIPVFGPHIYWICIGVYMLVRMFMRMTLSRRLYIHFRGEDILRVVLLPSLMGITAWDYLIETRKEYVVGQIILSKNSLKVHRRLAKGRYDGIVEAALESTLGKMFQDFTPYFHVSYYWEEGRHIVKFLDLRYLIKNEFMHSGTLVLDQKKDVVESVFHPYNNKRNIKL